MAKLAMSYCYFRSVSLQLQRLSFFYHTTCYICLPVTLVICVHVSHCMRSCVKLQQNLTADLQHYVLMDSDVTRNITSVTTNYALNDLRLVC